MAITEIIRQKHIVLLSLLMNSKIFLFFEFFLNHFMWLLIFSTILVTELFINRFYFCLCSLVAFILPWRINFALKTKKKVSAFIIAEMRTHCKNADLIYIKWIGNIYLASHGPIFSHLSNLFSWSSKQHESHLMLLLK